MTAQSGRLVVLVSGSGTNLQALIDAIAAGELDARIAAVVSDRKAAYGLVRAEQNQIPAVYFPAKPFAGADRPREAYDTELALRVAQYKPEVIVLAGFMRILTPAFLDRFPRRVINLHPALPGEYPGTNAIERAFADYEAGALSRSGCMVHYVVPEVDAGPVIVQAEVPFEPGDTLESFANRMHAAEHRIIVEATGRVLSIIRREANGTD